MDLKKILADHALWLSGNGGFRADLQGANLQYASLQYADLRGADLQGANFDFSCWLLWCGSLKVKIDERQASQLAYHLLSVWRAARSAAMLKLANKFHRTERPRLKKVK